MSSITRSGRRPWWMMRGAHEPRGDVFRDWAPGTYSPWDREERQALTNVDLFEQDGNLVLRAELPGVRSKDINLSVDRESLSIEATRAAEREEKGKNFFIQESSRGALFRTIPLPDEVDTDNTEACFEDGVLTVTMPKSDNGTRRRIPRR